MRTARILASLLGLAVPLAPPAAFAQQAAPPSYARPPANGEETVHGRINLIDGKYRLEVRDDRGFIDNVEMHQGTIINPTGLQLEPGMTVTILGYNRGSTLAANEIDTPYESFGVVPLVYPYPYDFSFGLGFGSGYRHFRR